MIDKTRLRLENAQISQNGIDKFSKPIPNSYNKNEIVSYRNVYFDREFNPTSKNVTDDEELEQSQRCLRIKLTLNTRVGKYKINIRGNIRKWYLGNISTRDFTRKDFVRAIEMLEKEIGLARNTLWNAIVTKIEIGVRLRMKERHRGLLFCIAHYKNFKKMTVESEFDEFKKMTVSNETVKFIGDKYSIIFYDKIKEVYDKSDMLQRNKKKATKSNLYLRYEIQIKSVTHMRPQIKENIKTLLLIKNNWKVLGEILTETLDDIMFVDILTPVTYNKIKTGAKTEIRDYLMCEGIQRIGVDNFLNLINVIDNRKKGEIRNSILQVYNEYLDQEKKVSYKKILVRKLGKRILALS